MSINSVSFGFNSNTRPYGYDPKKGQFTPEQAMKDFKPGIYDPEQQEKVEKRKKNIKKAIIIGAGVVVAAGLTYFFTKGKGKDWVKKLIDKFKGNNKVDTIVGNKKPKVKTQAATVKEHSNLLPGEKVKMNGKENAHKVRRNKKAITEATRLREEAERITEKDLKAYAEQFGYKAPTTEQAAFIAENNKPAVNTIGDFVERQQAENLARVTKRMEAQKAAGTVAETVVDNAAKIAELQAKIAKQEAAIAKYSANPVMARYAKPYEAAKAKLVEELAQLQRAAS